MKQLRFVTSVFSTVVVVLSFMSCGMKLKIPIERGKIAGPFSIQFLKSGKAIKTNEFFSLDELGVKANGGKINKKIMLSTDIKSAMKLFRKQKIRNYDIVINNPAYSKPYYGKIAFFNTNKKNELEAVSRYYELDISSSYFSSATRGRVAIVYEYANVHAGLIKVGEGLRVPTWIILLSDEPV